MEHSLPDWNFDESFHLYAQKKSIRPDDELVELLWRDGQVVLQSQAHHREPTPPRTQVHQQNLSRANALLEDQETVSWIQYPPDDPFQSEFSSRLFSTIPQLGPEKPPSSGVLLREEETRKHETGPDPRAMPPPPGFGFSDTKEVEFGEFGKGSSVMTVGPSHCGSNQLQSDVDVTAATATNTTGLSVGSLKGNGGNHIASKRDRTKINETLDPNATSSSGGSSGCSFGRNSKERPSGIIGGDRKRKQIMETEESVSQTYATGNKSSNRSGSTRRSRSAEVHNLSERRRRDRINERMRALQELIPHCSKTDKASILDEAIDYLKSLQLQLQVMWMRSGMAASPMMFQGVQPPYIPHVGSMRLPTTFPVLDRSSAQNPGLVCENPVQTQSQAFSEQLARYIAGFPQIQATSQNMNMSRFGSQTGQQSQAPATADNLPSTQ